MRGISFEILSNIPEESILKMKKKNLGLSAENISVTDKTFGEY